MTVEVRCCCEPGKLLGWVQLQEDRVVEGRVIRFLFYEAPPAWGGETPMPSMIEARVRLFEQNEQGTIEPGRERRRVSWLALDSGHAPLETWRKVRAFTPATGR